MQRWCRALLAVLSLAAASSPAAAQLRASAYDAGPRPVAYRLEITSPASTARIAGQIAGGALAAAALGAVAWAAFDNPEGSDRRVKGDAGYTPNANSAYAAASFIGSTAAVYWIGRGDGSRGSLAATALGAAVVTIPLALLRHEPYLPVIGIVLGAPLQAVAAAVGYQLTRRER